MTKGTRLTKRVVDVMAPRDARYIVWDGELKGFGLRIETSGTKTYLVRYRPRDGGARAPKRFVTIGQHGRPFGSEGAGLTPDGARREAGRILGLVANGQDPADERAMAKARPTLQALIDSFMQLHVRPKLKPNTAEVYSSTFNRYLLPKWGRRRAEDISKADLAKLHAALAVTKATADLLPIDVPDFG